jgi:hypothetical protein
MSLLKKFLRTFSAAPASLDVASDNGFAEAKQSLESCDSSELFVRLNEMKASRTPVRNVDLLRALHFQKHNDPFGAMEALKEELRFFPDNHQASELLKTLAARHHFAPGVKDPEFLELFEVVRPYTMVGPARLHSLFQLAKHVCQEDVPGQFVECGVAAGGSSALLAAVIARYSRRPRRLFCFDTFAGMPAASDKDTHQGQFAENTGWGSGTCAATQASLREVCQKLGVAERVEPIQGLFADTLPIHRRRIGEIAFLHMDGDWYSSTRDILENLFDQIVAGGRIQIDDYGYWEGCKRAVTEFEQNRGLKFQITPIDETGVWLPR